MLVVTPDNRMLRLEPVLTDSGECSQHNASGGSRKTNPTARSQNMVWIPNYELLIII
jgi:hypothetical protein